LFRPPSNMNSLFSRNKIIMVVAITEKVIAELVESNEYTKAQGEKIANLVMKYAEEKSSELENKPNRQGTEKLATPPDREGESSKTEWRPLAQRRQQRAEAEMRLVVGDYALFYLSLRFSRNTFLVVKTRMQFFVSFLRRVFAERSRHLMKSVR